MFPVIKKYEEYWKKIKGGGVCFACIFFIKNFLIKTFEPILYIDPEIERLWNDFFKLQRIQEKRSENKQDNELKFDTFEYSPKVKTQMSTQKKSKIKEKKK